MSCWVKQIRMTTMRWLKVINLQKLRMPKQLGKTRRFLRIRTSARGISKNSADLTLEDSIASLALHDLVKIGNSTELLIPVKGNPSVDQFQIYSETNLDNPAHMCLCLSLEVPSSTDNQMCNEEQNKQGILESENLRGHLAAATCEGNKNAFLGNQWTDSLSMFSPSLEALACSFSPATPSETWNPQSGEPDITSLTCVAAAETAEAGGNEKHSEWSQSLGQFSPSLEAFAHSLSNYNSNRNWKSSFWQSSHAASLDSF